MERGTAAHQIDIGETRETPSESTQVRLEE